MTAHYLGLMALDICLASYFFSQGNVVVGVIWSIVAVFNAIAAAIMSDT